MAESIYISCSQTHNEHDVKGANQQPSGTPHQQVKPYFARTTMFFHHQPPPVMLSLSAGS
eukprot:XP_001697635.1 predicted protein [Chlamydomonas reinhardtii]